MVHRYVLIDVTPHSKLLHGFQYSDSAPSRSWDWGTGPTKWTGYGPEEDPTITDGVLPLTRSSTLLEICKVFKVNKIFDDRHLGDSWSILWTPDRDLFNTSTLKRDHLKRERKNTTVEDGSEYRWRVYYLWNGLNIPDQRLLLWIPARPVQGEGSM